MMVHVFIAMILPLLNKIIPFLLLIHLTQFYSNNRTGWQRDNTWNLEHYSVISHRGHDWAPYRSEQCVPSCVNVTCVRRQGKTRNSLVCRLCANILTWWKLCWHNVWIRASYVFFSLSTSRTLRLRTSRHIVPSSVRAVGSPCTLI